MLLVLFGSRLVLHFWNARKLSQHISSSPLWLTGVKQPWKQEANCLYQCWTFLWTHPQCYYDNFFIVFKDVLGRFCADLEMELYTWFVLCCFRAVSMGEYYGVACFIICRNYGICTNVLHWVRIQKRWINFCFQWCIVPELNVLATWCILKTISCTMYVCFACLCANWHAFSN